MTEIEKMFENAGVAKQYCSVYETNKQCEGIVECFECASADYLPFTAEKQLELIKWFAKIYELSINWDEQYISYRFVIRNYQNRRLNHCVCSHEEPFEETLAYLINRIWQDLNNQEKEEIRGVLK